AKAFFCRREDILHESPLPNSLADFIVESPVVVHTNDARKRTYAGDFWPPLPLKTHRQVTERQAAQLTRLCPQGEPNCPRSRAIESTQANDLRRPPRLNRKTHCAQQSNTRSRIKADFRSLRESLSCVRKL